MISEKLLKALNEQMNFEFESAHTYMAMAAWCSAESLDGFANFFLVQAEEERFHGMKLYQYINDRREKAYFTGYETPVNDFDSMLDVFQRAFEHEKKVTSKIYDLSDIALDEREHATIQFLKFFLDEQVEEEALFDSIIEKLKRIQDDSTALYLLDEEFANRTFSPEEE